MSTMNNNQSTNGYSTGGGSAASNTEIPPVEEEEFGRTEEEFYEDMQRELSDDAPWKRIQQNTFTRWANEHLKLVNRHIDDLQAELSDGLNLIALIEVLSQKKLPRYNRRPNFRSQKLENVSVALDFLENTERIRLVNIDATHIVDGKLKLILGLIWTLILHYSISLPMWEFEQPDAPGSGRDATPKQKLMNWVQGKLPPELPISNFTSDWNDGRAIGALVDSCAPGLYPDWNDQDPKNALENAKKAMELAENWLGVPQLIQPHEMINPKVDEQSMMTYLSQYPNAKLKPGAPIRPKTNSARVRCYGKGIEPTGNHVDAPAKFHVETSAAGKGNVEVIVINPKGQKEKCDIEFRQDKNQTYDCTYQPTMEGQYKVIVKFAGQEVPKSPFSPFIEGKSGDASQCRVHGPGIEPNGVMVDKPTWFEIDATKAGNGLAEVVIVNPRKQQDAVPVSVKQTAPGKFRCEYVPREPGLHSVNVLFAGRPVPNSPYGVNVAPSSDAKKCRAYGRGIQPKGVRTGNATEFRIVTKDAGEGVLKVTITGPDGAEVPCRVTKANNTTYECGYLPNTVGPHQVSVTYGGADIPKSPFPVLVGPFKNSRIRAFGPGLEGGVVGYPADFVVETNGETGSLGFSIEGPSQARIECNDNGDGSADVRYWPTIPGEYAVHILCNDDDIPNSPFMAWIEPPANFDANKVKAYGPGLETTGQIIGKATEFTVDTHSAGDAPLRVQAIDQEYEPVDVQVRNNGNGTYTCRYTPRHPIRHCILIDYGGVAVPHSPFRVWPTEPSNPAKVRVHGPGVERGVKMNVPTHFTVDCKEAGPGDISIALTDAKNQDVPFTIDDNQDGTFTIGYTPKAPGIHCISVLFADNEIPISPLKVNVEPSIDVNKIRIEGLETRVFLESPTEFTVDAKSVTGSGTGNVECVLTSPSNRKVRCPVKNNNDGTYLVQYAPYEVGMHQLDVTYENIPVPGAPFRVDVSPGCDPKRVRAYGPGLESATTNESTTFTIETKGAGQGSLGLAIEGPSEAKMVCKDNQDGTCLMEYIPIKAGQYDIAIKFADQHIPGSPFKVHVRDRLDASRVNVKTSATMRANVLQEISIDGQTAGPGTPSVEITDAHGRRKPASIRPRGDGVYVAEFTPQNEGPHRIDIQWSGESVHQSPLNVQVLPNFEPNKVRVDGPGVTNGVPASLETSFHIDTREAGVEHPDVLIKNSEGLLISSKIVDNKDGTYKVIYKPNDVGRYLIHVNYGGIPVKNSPFNVKVEPTGDPTKCQISGNGIKSNVHVGEECSITVDTHEAGPGAVTCRIRSAVGNDLDIDIVDNEDGTFNLYYTPHNPGNYVIKIRFGGQDIPGGDFVVTAGDSEQYLRQTHHVSETVTSSQYRPVDFRLPVGGGHPNEITASIRTPTGRLHAPIIEDNHDGTVSIKYQPAEIGLHELDVFYQGQPIAGSPFKFHVDQIQTGYVTAYGPGLSHGVCNQPCSFRIVTKDAGSGGLSVAVEGSSKAEIQCKDNKDGTCDVTYWPTSPGEYTITVKFADKHIVGSPFTAKITGLATGQEYQQQQQQQQSQQRSSQVMVGNESEISLRISELDIHDLTATIRSPSGVEEGCLLKRLANGSLGISFIPREMGDHLVNVYRDGKHIKNSPFRIHVGSSEIGDATKVKVFGRGLHEGHANQTNEFTVVTRDAGYGGLSLSIEGPSKADIECQDNEDGSCLVTYRPTEPGVYIVNVKFADKHVPGSPFTVNVGGQGTSRLRESITRERRAADITHIGSQCELLLRIPGTSPFDMSAYVTSPTGRLENCEIVDLNDCNYSVKFIPKEMGVHTVSVKHRDMHIPGSPFEFTVGAIQGGGAHKVRASGNGLIRGEVNASNEFNIYTREAGAGGLAIAVEGPSKAEIDFFDRKDGSCGVSYTCPEPGEYQISIKFNDEHIPESPFNVSIVPPFGDAKKLTIHSLKAKGLEVNKSCTFTVNTNGVRGRLDARVIAPSGAEDICSVQEVSDDHHTIRFTPKENGIHWIHVRFNGRDIPESPIRIFVGQSNADPGRVFASGNGLYHGETGHPCEFLIDTVNAGAGALAVTVDGPSKVQLDCKEVAEGYRVQFTPTAPGDYLITIKFAGTNIAGSPFKCVVGGSSIATNNRGSGSGGGLSTMTTSSSSYVQRSQGNVTTHTRYDTIEKSSSYSTNANRKEYVSIDASRVRAQGEGLTRAYRNEKATFTVDTREGGNAMLMVGVFGPKYPCEEVFIKHIGNNQYNVQYTVREKGEYMLVVKWGDQHIPGSPWHIEVV